MEELALDSILAASMVLAVVLILVSAGAFGRKLSDLEYQRAAGIDGVRRIQSHIAVRVHANRILMGVTFVVFSSLLLAGAPMDLRTWSFRLMFLALLACFVGSAVLDWLGEREQMRLLMRGEPAPAVDVATIQEPAVQAIVAAVRDDKP